MDFFQKVFAKAKVNENVSNTENAKKKIEVKFSQLTE